LEKEFVNGEETQTVSEQYWDIKKEGTFKMTSFYGSGEVIKNWKVIEKSTKNELFFATRYLNKTYRYEFEKR
jgi:hypothetical protein